jgi:hypothetical protein
MLNHGSRRLIACGAAGFLGMAAISGAPALGMPTSVDLAVPGTTRLDGLAAGDRAGSDVSAAGDINHDGYDDILIGAASTDANAGAAFIVLGYPTQPNRVLAELGTSGFRISAASAGDAVGTSVADAGDVNGDGFDDVLIGAPQADPGGMNEGSVYLVFGRQDPGPVDLGTPGPQWVRIDGAHPDDQVGTRVAAAGDVNGDGYDDVILGSEFLDPNGPFSGGAYVVYGSAHPGPVDLGSVGPWGFAIDGGAVVDFAGAVAGAGDVNKDGFDDVILGARGVDVNGDGAGASYVIYGRSAGHAIDLGALAPADGFRIDGAAPKDNSGYAVAGAGDVNADGFDDVIVSSHNASPDAVTQAGSADLVYGAAARTVVNLASPGSAAVRVDGVAAGDMAGWSVAGVGDVNRDQTPDLLIGARFADPDGRLQAGAAYLVYGGVPTSQLDLASLGAAGVRVDGAAAGDEAGTSVAGAGDVNGDGSRDVLIGAPRANPGGRTDAGSVYLLLGDPKPPDPGPPPAATLHVTARAAKKAIPRTGKTTLVRRVRVGAGQKVRITVGVTPRKTAKRATVTKTATSARIRTRKAPKGTVKVLVRASGPGVTTVFWKRSWRIR